MLSVREMMKMDTLDEKQISDTQWNRFGMFLLMLFHGPRRLLK